MYVCMYVCIFRDRGREKVREKNITVRNIDRLPLATRPDQGPNPQLRQVPSWGIEPKTFCCAGRHPTNWVPLVRDTNLKQVAHSHRVIRAESGFKFRQLADSKTILLMCMPYQFPVIHSRNIYCLPTKPDAEGSFRLLGGQRLMRKRELCKWV